MLLYFRASKPFLLLIERVSYIFGKLKYVGKGFIFLLMAPHLYPSQGAICTTPDLLKVTNKFFKPCFLNSLALFVELYYLDYVTSTKASYNNIGRLASTTSV